MNLDPSFISFPHLPPKRREGSLQEHWCRCPSPSLRHWVLLGQSRFKSTNELLTPFRSYIRTTSVVGKTMVFTVFVRFLFWLCVFFRLNSLSLFVWFSGLVWYGSPVEERHERSQGTRLFNRNNNSGQIQLKRQWSLVLYGLTLSRPLVYTRSYSPRPSSQSLCDPVPTSPFLCPRNCLCTGSVHVWRVGTRGQRSPSVSSWNFSLV